MIVGRAITKQRAIEKRKMNQCTKIRTTTLAIENLRATTLLGAIKKNPRKEEKFTI